jgi:hypothetical protein
MSFFKDLFQKKGLLPEYEVDIRGYDDEYEEMPMFVVADMGLATIAPVPGFDHYIAVLLNVPINKSGKGEIIADNELKALHRVEDRCIKESERRGFLYAGHAIVTAADNMYIAFYCKGAEKAAAVETFKAACQAQGRAPSKVLCMEDADWGYYFERLYPDEYHLQTLNNMDIVDALARHGDNSNKPRDVRFWIHLKSKTDLDRCLAEAVKAGFELSSTIDSREGQRLDGATEERPVTLELKKQLTAVVEALDVEARILIDIANQFDGHYDGCEADLVK